MTIWHSSFRLGCKRHFFRGNFSTPQSMFQLFIGLINKTKRPWELCLETSTLSTLYLPHHDKLGLGTMIVVSCSVMSNSVTSWTARLLCPWNFLGKNTGLCCHFLLQGIFLTQRSNPCLLYFLPCRQILYPLSQLGSPIDNWYVVNISKSIAYCEKCYHLQTNFKVNWSWESLVQKGDPTSPS